jgi:hypothetical protein
MDEVGEVAQKGYVMDRDRIILVRRLVLNGLTIQVFSCLLKRSGCGLNRKQKCTKYG